MIKYKVLMLRHLRAGGAHNLLILNDLCWHDPIVQINKNTKKIGGLRLLFYSPV